MQKDGKLQQASLAFSIKLIHLYDRLEKKAFLKNQMARAGTSIGANIHEARYAQSRADFISKLEISLKEASESDYWLELLYRKKKLTQEQYFCLRNECGSIRRKLIASITTAKSNVNKEHL